MRLQRVHLYQWQMRAQSAFQPAVVSVCCFINNACHRRLCAELGERLKSRRAIAKRHHLPIAQPVNVQSGFGNIYTNGIIRHLRHILCLS